LKRRGIAPETTNIRFGHDPIGAFAQQGVSDLAWRDLAPRFAAHVAGLAAAGFKGPFAVADGRVIHNAGGSEAQELAFALATAVAYLRALDASGTSLEQARGMISFRLSADADQFLTVAKFRALRQLWAHVEEACGLALAPPFVSAETAWRMTTQRDPYVNMLRATIAVLAAGLGGADAISVLPYTAAIGLPDRFARRIARNTQLVLIEESNLARVADPAAGSGAIEALTRQLCRAAWAQFQDIEAEGGAASALERGLIQRNVAAVRSERQKAVATRKVALTGTSEFPNIDEPPISVLDVPQVTVSPLPPNVTAEPLVAIRLAQPFEQLRDASDRILAATGSRPKVFLANLGTPADFTARATFARNFFAAGGIEAVTREGDASPNAIAAAFRASGAALACLCSSDTVYQRHAAAAAKTLSTAGARHVYLAGQPRDREAALRAAGVQSFIYAGCDVLATLRAAHGILGIR
jgi:methylmalonyl-CoA mutase